MKRLLALAAALLVVGLAPIGGLDAGSAYDPDGEELAFLGIINNYRAENGLGELALSATLGAAAEHHSLDMGTHGYFAHTLADGTTAGENIVNHGYTDETWGENIAGGMESARENFVAWRNSPGHDANMLRADFAAIGIGRAYVAGSPSGWYWTTTFGGEVDRRVREPETEDAPSGAAGAEVDGRPADEPAPAAGDRPETAEAEDDESVPDQDLAAEPAEGAVDPAGEQSTGQGGDAGAGGEGGSVAFGDVITGNLQAGTVVVGEPTSVAGAATGTPVTEAPTGPESPDGGAPAVESGADPAATDVAVQPTAASEPTVVPSEIPDATETSADESTSSDGAVTPEAGPTEGADGASDAARTTASAEDPGVPDCSAFVTQAEAQAFYDSVGGVGSKDAVVAAFDPGYDGIACEEFKLP